MHSSRMFPVFIQSPSTSDEMFLQILTSRIRHFSRDSQPLWLVLSGESGVLLRQVAPDIWEHPRPLPQGRASPHRERLSQGRSKWFAKGFFRIPFFLSFNGNLLARTSWVSWSTGAWAPSTSSRAAPTRCREPPGSSRWPTTSWPRIIKWVP